SRQPPQRAQAGHEAVLAASHGDETRQAMKALADRPLGNGEDAVALVIADERILLGSMTDEIAVGHPLRLHELELLPLVRADQQEHAPTLDAVILEHAIWQRRSVIRAAAQEVVAIDVYDIVFRASLPPEY